jgi:hypothetical protein
LLSPFPTWSFTFLNSQDAASLSSYFSASFLPSSFAFLKLFFNLADSGLSDPFFQFSAWGALSASAVASE